MSTERDVSEFFERKRAAALLIHLGEDEGGKIVRELGDDLGIAPKTLNELLEKASEAGLVTTGRKAGDHGNAKRYVLTNEGQVIRDKMDDMGMVETYYDSALHVSVGG
jgi:DNA-binding MarR family transcriptional regulator